MGSAFRILNAGNEHIVKQSQIDAARVIQKSRNAAQLSLVESKKIVQAANNVASQSFADARKKVQGANNAAEAALFESNTKLRDASNVLSATVTSGRRAVQAAGNGLAATVTNARRSIQTAGNSAARAQMRGKLALQAKFNDEAIQVAEARKVLQAARTERAAVETDVSNWMVSLRNQKRTDAMGKQVSYLQEQIGTTLDGSVVGRAFDRIANSEALGATIANAAAAGIGGSSVEAFNTAMSMRQAMKEEREDRELASRVLYAKRQQAEALGAAYDGFGGFGRAELDREIIIAEQDNSAVFDEQNFDPILDQQNFDPILDEQNFDPLYRSQDYSAIIADQDFEVFTPDLDFTQYVDHKKMSGLQKVATFIGAGVATYYGGPKAGNAVFDASMAINDMQNGNFAGAQQGFTNAFGNAVGGFRTFRAGATDGGIGSAWGPNLFKSKPVSGYKSDVGTVNFGASLKLGG
jgi:hypothetical protein